MRTTWRARLQALLTAGLLWLLAVPGAAAQARELRWRALDVEAYLDAEGALHVTERHRMVFTGDWNGGERVFAEPHGQTVELQRIVREDPESGARLVLAAGDLEQVDEYRAERASSAPELVVRWRSRAADDPPFDRRPLDYELQYVVYGAPESQGNVVSLAHDFAFTRPGPIEQLTIVLSLDPVWRPLGEFPGTWRARDLAHDAGFVVRAQLRSAGWLAPRRIALSCALVALWLLAYVALLVSERRRGRLRPLEVVSLQNEGLLDEHLLGVCPELVAVLWTWAPADHHAVAALLTRMELEGKLVSQVGAQGLTLRLLVDRATLTGYERALVDGLFFGGDTTSTEAVRAHYATARFDPAALLQQPLSAAGRPLLGPFRPWWPLFSWSFGLFALAVLVLLLAPGDPLLPVLAGSFASLFVWLFGAGFATEWRRRVDWGVRQSLIFAVPAALPVVIVVGLIVAQPYALVFEVAMGLALMACAGAGFVLGMARTRESAAGLLLRRRLTAIRCALLQQVARGDSLEVRLVPYLFAFGLQKDARRWTFHVQHETGGPQRGGSNTILRSEHTSDTYKGGGGGFGGAGATADWASAVSGLSVGVSSSSSSGSGGSGSSGGGRSGGGSAGGW